MMSKLIKIFDTTLRDGEQSPGCSMNLKEKIEMAKQLERLKVDIIEAGFAAASPGDMNAIREIASEMINVTVASLARAEKDDIDKAWESIRQAADPRIHTFIATSPIHMKYKLQMKPEQVMDQAEAMVKYAKKYVSNIEFSAEDATRSEIDFLAKIFTRAIKAGATTINIPDTVGYTTPDEYYEFLMELRRKCPALDRVAISVHCHNDLGLGVANSLAAMRAGATQIECTINGIGERAGNAALEEIVMAVNTRKDRYDYQFNIETTQIIRSSELLTSITGVKVQPNKAIVGSNAFAHEAGIHQHGMLSNKATYEIMTPESVGLTKNKLVLGKHSGRHAFNDKIISMGYHLTKGELDEAFKKFKDIADKKKEVYDRDIDALVSRQNIDVPKELSLERFVINSGNTITSTASVRIIIKNEMKEEVATGDGPIDAVFKAIEKIVGKRLKLEDYALNSVTEGEDALGDATVKLRENGHVYIGRGLSTDVVEASVKAYINAVNKMIYDQEQNKEAV
ncbi:MAG TPA: 2-isopropylmalate synthase [Clostridiales bacterium]|nr:2-isopropylmalate synthase [Clostridiales bacterium]